MKPQFNTPNAVAQAGACGLEAVILSVPDVQRTEAFYQTALAMKTVTGPPVVDVALPADIRWLQAADARGALLGLTLLAGAESRRSAGKLVFYVRDTAHFADSFREGGGELLLPPTEQVALGGMQVGFGLGPDGQLIEFVGMGDARHSYLSAVGIGVSDLEAARDFYLQRLCWTQSHLLSVPDQYDEYILVSEAAGSSALVLMHWTRPLDIAEPIPPKLIFSFREVAMEGTHLLDADGHQLWLPKRDCTQGE